MALDLITIPAVSALGRGSQWSAAMVGVVGGASGCSPRLLHSHAAGPARPCQTCIVLCVCIVHSCSHRIGDAMCLNFGTGSLSQMFKVWDFYM